MRIALLAASSLCLISFVARADTITQTFHVAFSGVSQTSENSNGFSNRFNSQAGHPDLSSSRLQRRHSV